MSSASLVNRRGSLRLRKVAQTSRSSMTTLKATAAVIAMLRTRDLSREGLLLATRVRVYYRVAFRGSVLCEAVEQSNSEERGAGAPRSRPVRRFWLPDGFADTKINQHPEFGCSSRIACAVTNPSGQRAIVGIIENLKRMSSMTRKLRPILLLLLAGTLVLARAGEGGLA